MREQDGFTLVGLMVAVAVVNIALAVAVSSWITIDRRAREAETIFRGQQIARAIPCFREAESRAPEKIEDLVAAGCLRRAWGDPMSRNGSWRLLTEQDLADGTVAALLGIATDSPAADGSGFTPIGSLFSAPAGVGQGGFTQSTQRGIVGVTPGARGASLREYRTRKRYEEWVFLAESGAS